MKKLLLFLLIAAVYAAHQDFWNWNKPDMILGFLPVGLAYQAGYSIACSVLMAILVETAWPKELEDTENSSK
jgi:hypothetical protein